jgi:hypothetical protein
LSESPAGGDTPTCRWRPTACTTSKTRAGTPTAVHISSWKLAFPAAYTSLHGSINSLLPTADRSFTGTATLYLGVRLWSGAEAYLVPEVISELPFDQLKGLGGAIQNSELQKGGAVVPQVVRRAMHHARHRRVLLWMYSDGKTEVDA